MYRDDALVALRREFTGLFFADTLHAYVSPPFHGTIARFEVDSGREVVI